MPIKTIFEPVYQVKIHFIFDTSKDKAYTYIRKQALIPMNFDDHWEKAGVMFGDDDNGDYFIVLPDRKPTWTITTIIAHEAFHVVARVMRNKGIVLAKESEEAFNYFHSWILQELTDLFCQHQKSKKPLKSKPAKKYSIKKRK